MDKFSLDSKKEIIEPIEPIESTPSTTTNDVDNEVPTCSSTKENIT